MKNEIDRICLIIKNIKRYKNYTFLEILKTNNGIEKRLKKSINKKNSRINFMKLIEFI